MNVVIKLSVALLVLASAAAFGASHMMERLTAGTLSSESSADELREQPQREVVAAARRNETVNSRDPLPGRAVSIRAGRNGHFFLDARVNGRQVPFLVDTGASYVALSYETARGLGFNLTNTDFKYRVNTANGRARVALIELDTIHYKSIRVNNVKALVSEPGALGDKNLLGNSFLSRLREYSVRNNRLVMIP